jgi:hypothetical protein
MDLVSIDLGILAIVLLLCAIALVKYIAKP